MMTTKTTATILRGSFSTHNSRSLQLRPAILKSNGFTLVEVVLTVVIIGILTTVALRTGSAVYTTAKVENTKQELNALADAIGGNPELENNGVRSDFGYVGDVGSMPPDLDALVSNPGGYGTWKGPYMLRRFSQIADDHKKDDWGADYTYSGGATITSTGAVTNIVRSIAGSIADLLLNTVSGNVFDLDGTPPGSTYRDSVVVRLTVPNGSGGSVTKTNYTDGGGYFLFDSIPIGNHDLDVIYLPNTDTLSRLVSVTPNSSTYSEYRLASDAW